MKIRLSITMFLFVFLLSAKAFCEENHAKPWSISSKDPVLEDKTTVSTANPYIAKSSPGVMFMWIIDFYKITSSSGQSCTFFPTCSAYTKEAIAKHGFILGLIMGAERIMRYHNDPKHYDLIEVGGSFKLDDQLKYNNFWF